MVAYALVETVSETDCVDQIFEYAAGGFRDSSRVASSDPVMWRDVCLENRDAILNSLAEFQARLGDLQVLIENSDADALLKLFAHAKNVRDKHVVK